MAAYDGFNNVQAKTPAVPVLRAALVQFVEPVKQQRQFFRRDGFSIVGNGKINLSLSQVGGEMLVVSQFTLYANCSHGNRPEFLSSAPPDEANRLYEYFVSYAKTLVPSVQTGIFGADMKVTLENDGPFTIYLDTEMLK